MTKRIIIQCGIYFALCFISIDAMAQVFQTTANFTNGRFAHSVAPSSFDRVLIFGGMISSGASTNAVLEYDPVLNVWSSKANIPNATGLSKSACVRLNNGTVLLFGGAQNGSTPQSNKVFQYNIAADSWTILCSLPNAQGRQQMRATLMNDSTVLLTGGLSSTSSSLVYQTSAYLFNTNTYVFTLVGNLANGIIDHTSTLLPNGEVLITGGFDGNGSRAEAFVFNLQNGWRTLTSSLSLAANAHRAVLVNGIVYLYGGFNIPLFEFSNKLDMYDPLLDSIMPMGMGPVACSQFTMIPFNSSILIAGGNKILPNTSFGVTDEAYLYNTINNTYTAISNLPSARSEMESVVLGGTGKFLMSGGNMGQSSPYDDAIVFDPNQLTALPQIDLQGQFGFFPNPCQNELHIEVNSETRKNSFVIFNAAGQVEYFGENNAAVFSVDTSKLPQGLYGISINGAAVKRFQVVR